MNHNRTNSCGADAGAMQRSAPRATFVPSIDVIERPDSVLLIADMPGVRPDAVEVQYERGRLTVHGTVTVPETPASAKLLFREFSPGDFDRSFQVGDGIDASKISASLKDGVLTVTLPKADEVMPRRITVRNE